MKIQFIPFILIITIIFSCSPVYHAADVRQINYNMVEGDSTGIILLHNNQRYLSFGGPTKHLKKAKKKNLWFLPVSIINHTEKEYTLLKNNIEIFNNYEKSKIILFAEYYDEIKYNSIAHSAWFAGGIIGGIHVTHEGMGYNYLSPFSLLFIPGTYFLAKAVKSNKILREDLKENDLIGKSIKPHTQVDGFICIQAGMIKDLHIRFIK